MKGIQKGKDDNENIVIRALSPMPKVTIKGNIDATISLFIENINPDFYAKSITGNNLSMTKVTVNTLKLGIVVC